MSFNFSRAYADATRMVGERFGPLLGIWAIFFILTIAVTFAFGASMVPMFMNMAAAGQDPSALSSSAGGMVATVLLVYALIAVISLANFGAMVTMASPLHRPGFGDAIGAGFKATPSAFVVLVVMVIGAFLLMLVIGLLGAALGGSGAGGLIVSLLTLAVFAYFFTKLSMIMPIMVIEGVRNPFTAMAQSWTQTNGNALMIFLAYFVCYLAFAAVVVLAVLGFGTSLQSSMATGEGPGTGMMIALFALYLIVVVGATMFIVALTAAIHAQLTGATTEGYSETFA